jgi:uncharacterized protein YecE (DUF72 family)
LPRSSSKPTLADASRSTAAALPDWRDGTMISMPPRIFAGTSGWAYPSWKPGFYPADIPAKRFLEYYGTQLNSVEVNYTFRTLPSAAILDGWLAATPADFRFSFKAPQRITHFSRLRECDAAVAEFVAALEPVRIAGRLGPLLFQLPPNFKADPALLITFLAAPAFSGQGRPRIAFEFRHESWFDEEIYAVLRANDVALCIAESDDLRTPEVECARDFACFRLRSSGGYSARQVTAFAEKFSTLAKSREVFVYFKHEEEPTGALNATSFLSACAAKAGKR